jgi:hypothetical protein
MQNVSPVGLSCKEMRSFEKISGEFENAFQHLQDSIGNIERSFAPAIIPEEPVPTSAVCDKVATQQKSEYQASMEVTVSRIHALAERLNNICARSGI